MNYFKILPAAASIIALTATFGFARDLRETEEDDSFRIRVELRESKNRADDIAEHSFSAAINSETGQIYRVEIKRGHKMRVVSIDAYTGRILGNTELSVKNS